MYQYSWKLQKSWYGRKEATIYQPLEIEQWNTISYRNRHYDVIIFECDSHHFTNARKPKITTGSLNFSSHEQIERLFR